MTALLWPTLRHLTISTTWQTWKKTETVRITTTRGTTVLRELWPHRFWVWTPMSVISPALLKTLSPRASAHNAIFLPRSLFPLERPCWLRVMSFRARNLVITTPTAKILPSRGSTGISPSSKRNSSRSSGGFLHCAVCIPHCGQ